jgi:hypothetical protein
MRERVRRIWFPGLLALVTTYLGQTIIFRYIEQPRIFQVAGTFIVVSYPWLVLLVGCGVISSWFCYHEGGSPRARLLVSQFPVLLMLGMFVLSFIVSFVFEPSIPLRLKLVSFLGYLVWSVLLPSSALLAGATMVIAREQFGREPEELKA